MRLARRIVYIIGEATSLLDKNQHKIEIFNTKIHGSKYDEITLAYLDIKLRTIYIDVKKLKTEVDIAESFAHELIHYLQLIVSDLKGWDFETIVENEYSRKSHDGTKLEHQAYLRSWEIVELITSKK